jgi:soluble lytic murein transglycosylase-like protein
LYDYAAQAAGQYGVPPGLFTAVINAESAFSPSAYNASSGATGIAQFLPSTAANPGYGIAPFDPTNPTSSLSAAAQYMAALFKRFGSWTGALNAYSGQPQGSTPYPGNAGVANALGAVSSPAGQGAAAGANTPGQSTGCSWTSPSCWFSTAADFLAPYASRGALILLAVTLLAGGVALFAFQTVEVSKSGN